MRIRLAVPDQLDDQERKEALNHALEAVTIANAGMMRRGLTPKIVPLIKAGRVKWKPEPPGDEHFDLASTVIGRGWGDCDDLAPAYAGQLRATGVDPGARAFVKRSGPTRWHAMVQRSDGSIEDPSRSAGMGHNVSGDGPVSPSFCKPMTVDPRLTLAIAPSRGRRGPRVWFARCDVPDAADPWSWSSKAQHPNAQSAILSAIKGVRHVAGEDIDDDDDYRLAVLSDLVLGADPYEIADELEDVLGDDSEIDPMELVMDGVLSLSGLNDCVGGSIFDSIAKAAGPITRSIARVVRPVAKYAAPVLSMVPGGGAAAAGILNSLSTGDPAAYLQAAMDPSGQMPIFKIREMVRQHPELAPLANMASGPLSMALTPFLGPAAGLASSEMTSFMANPGQQPPPGVPAGRVPMQMPQQGGGYGYSGSDQDVMTLVPQLLAMLMGVQGNGPISATTERGQVSSPYGPGRPMFLRF